MDRQPVAQPCRAASVKPFTPAGGWLGPSTHDWPDLRERDVPSFMRDGPGGKRAACPRPPEDQRWKPKEPTP